MLDPLCVGRLARPPRRPASPQLSVRIIVPVQSLGRSRRGRAAEGKQRRRQTASITRFSDAHVYRRRRRAWDCRPPASRSPGHFEETSTSPPPAPLDDHIAGRPHAGIRFLVESFEGQIRIAGAEDAVGAEILADLGFERPGDVDLGQNAKALALEGLLDGPDHGVELAVRLAGYGAARLFLPGQRVTGPLCERQPFMPPGKCLTSSRPIARALFSALRDRPPA